MGTERKDIANGLWEEAGLKMKNICNKCCITSCDYIDECSFNCGLQDKFDCDKCSFYEDNNSK